MLTVALPQPFVALVEASSDKDTFIGDLERSVTKDMPEELQTYIKTIITAVNARNDNYLNPVETMFLRLYVSTYNA